ncbi:MAG: VTT domain-containing protein [Gammaproteobacteria bacterium]|nr:VTT domain-containing protein [Gammaproteobacteria bacterium]
MGTILQPGRNCWHLVPADGVAFAIDAVNYFGPLAEAIGNAEQSVIALGWDMDSRMRFGGCDWRDDERRLAAFLQATLEHRPPLHIYLLSWDFALIFALEREPLLPTAKGRWGTHRRLRFALDGSHPLAASHHQKIVVVDDQFAFVGGLDLTIRRFDTRQHRPHDPCRTDPAGHPYGPFHDVQIAVSGKAAAALGRLARQRWHRATGEIIPPPGATGAHWPESLAQAVRNIPVAISRTEPAYNGHPEITEIRQLYIDALTAARRYIYIENQYFTAACIGDALRAVLGGADPPEVVIVLPQRTSGWLQEHTMGLLRARLVGLLRTADRHNRLRICYPHAEDLGDDYIRVHSKVLILDDRLLSIGSANTNNRSMGLDSECNLTIEADDGPAAGAIRDFKEDLLAEHLHLTRSEVRTRLAADPSLIHLIDSCAGGPRALRPVDDSPVDETDIPETWIADPERPVDARDIFPHDVRHNARLRLLRNAILLAAIASLSALWSHTPLHVWLNISRLVHLLRGATTLAAAPVITLIAFIVGGAAFFPITLLIIATAIAFPPPQSLLYAFLGCLASTSVNYAAGRLLHERYVARLGGRHWQRLRERLKNRGLMTMITMGLVPIAPFTLVTVGAGSLRVRYRNVLIGAGIGVAPGILTISLFTGTLTRALARPEPAEIAILVLLAAVIVSFILWIRRWLAQHRDKKTVFERQ